MVNQYRRGARVENLIADELRERGYDVIRSAGSKGAADLTAVHDGELCFIQVKVGSTALPSPAERTRLLRIAGRVRAYALVAYRMEDPTDRRKQVTGWRHLTGSGPRDWQPWIPRGEGQ